MAEPLTPWPIRVCPAASASGEPTELLSSWILRLAHANGLTAEGLVSAVFGVRYPIWNRDTDRGDAEQVLERLAQVSATDVETIRACALRSYEGRLAAAVARSARTPGIIPLSVFHRTRRANGLMFCPACLAQGAVPYFRKTWRIAYLCACAVHHSEFLEACPSCNAPLAPHRADLNLNVRKKDRGTWQAHCWRCGFDLRTSERSECDSRQAVLAATCAEAIEFGATSIQGQPVHALPFFSGLHALVLLAWRQVRDSVPQHQPASAYFEQTDLRQRAAALSLVGEWVVHWPAAFVEFAQHSRVAASEIRAPSKPLAYWVDEVVRTSLMQKRAAISAAEAAAVAGHLAGQYAATTTRNLRAVSGRAIDGRHLSDVHRRTVDDETYELLIAHVDHQISRSGSQERLHLLADKVWIALVRVDAWSLERVRQVSAQQLAQMARGEVINRWRAPRTLEELRAWLHWYLKDIRPRIAGGDLVPNAFLSRSPGRALTANGLSARFRGHLESAMLGRQVPDLLALSRAR